jgi:hypothetical protein
MTDAIDSLTSDLKEFYAKAYEAGARDFEGLVHHNATYLATSLRSKTQKEAILAFRDAMREIFESRWIEAQKQALTREGG